MILGLDFATKTGVAYGDAGAPPARVMTETWMLPSGGGDDVGPFMHALRTKLDDRMMRGVSLVVFEAPYIAAGKDYRGRTVHRPDQIRRAFGAAAICEEVAYARGIRVVEVVTVTLKKEFALHGRADKPAMIAAAKGRGFTIANDHEADACACFVHGVKYFHPDHIAAYDPLFANRTGGSRG